MKARVLPEPVQDFTITSLFDRKRGITAFYTFVTLLKPRVVVTTSDILSSNCFISFQCIYS